MFNQNASSQPLLRCHCYVIPVIFGKPNNGCPDPHLLHPCICLRGRSILTCEDLDNEDVLKSVTKVSQGLGIVGVEFVSAAIRYIPEDAFEGMNNIQFLSITNSSISALSDTTRAFRGLEKSLKSLTVQGCPFVSQWEWTQLANLTHLEELEISESELLELSVDFYNSLSHLPITNVKFMDESLQTLPENAFSTFKDLNKVSLDRNQLTRIQRTLLPRPAKKLQSLGFSYNSIRFLPDDMFADMPALKFLYLGDNPLHILEENTFKPIWRQLSMFLFQGVPLICDCRLSWFTKWKNERKFIVASCSNPMRLKGRKITTLESDELRCSMLSQITPGAIS